MNKFKSLLKKIVKNLSGYQLQENGLDGIIFALLSSTQLISLN